MTSPLTGALPESVTISGREYPIRHDHATGILFEEMLRDARIPEEAKVSLSLDIWFGDSWPDEDIGQTIDAMMRFYRCGKPEPPRSEGSSKRLFSYEYDHDAIYAAFLSTYGIDLYSGTPLHWWRFSGMLQALPESTAFMRIVGIRAAKFHRNMGREERAALKKLKRLYALPEDESARPVKLKTPEDVRSALDSIIALKKERAACTR